jgi:lysozyme family protein
MSIFDKNILDLEGISNNNDPDDLGKLTKYGISQRQYPSINIESLTAPEALIILERDYWDFYNLSLISNQKLANKICQMFVNMRPTGAATCVQLAIHACGKEINIDGILGSVTILALNSIDAKLILMSVKLELINFYLGRVMASPTQEKYLKGWIKRALA